MIAFVQYTDEVRPFRSKRTGREGVVQDALIYDKSGSIKLTLWGDDVNSVSTGDKLKLTNMWCSEFKKELSLSKGRRGCIEKLSHPVQQRLED